MIFIFSFILLLLVLYYFILNVKRKNVYFDIKYGRRCYICKEIIEKKNNLFPTFEEEIISCHSCERDLKLNKVIGCKRYIITNSLKKYLLSDNYKKIFNWFVILQVFAFSSILLFSSKIAVTIINIININNIIYWIIIIFRSRISTIKKPSTK